MYHSLAFNPTPGLASPHAQMFLANFGPTGTEPPATKLLVELPDGDKLSCEVSTPPNWQPDFPTLVMVHGAGGSHLSPYMIRVGRRFFHANYRVVRINMRGAGSGVELCNLPYNFGTSQDIWEVVKKLKKDTPHSSIRLLGFSMGGSLIIKMCGELGEKAQEYVEGITAVCPVLDLVQTVKNISLKSNWLYHRYFLKKFLSQGRKWTGNRMLKSIQEFDEHVTAPLWGYKNAVDYYEQCSSCKFISNVKVSCDVLLAADDPFIDPLVLKQFKLSPYTKVWVTKHGGHMGFIGSDQSIQGPFWMDKLLLKWHKDASHLISL